MIHTPRNTSTGLTLDRPMPAQLSRRRFLLLTGMGIAGTLGLGAGCSVKRWRYIVVHHSAGQFGNVEFLNKVHRQRQPNDLIDSMPYHFVVGNGNGLKLGEIDYGMRWQTGLWGAHVSARNHRCNFWGIGICLIGNFHENALPESQYEALVDLVRRLSKNYCIPSSRIFTHGRLKGERTACPGKHFPYRRFTIDIA